MKPSVTSSEESEAAMGNVHRQTQRHRNKQAQRRVSFGGTKTFSIPKRSSLAPSSSSSLLAPSSSSSLSDPSLSSTPSVLSDISNLPAPALERSSSSSSSSSVEEVPEVVTGGKRGRGAIGMRRPFGYGKERKSKSLLPSSDLPLIDSPPPEKKTRLPDSDDLTLSNILDLIDAPDDPKPRRPLRDASRDVPSHPSHPSHPSLSAPSLSAASMASQGERSEEEREREFEGSTMEDDAPFLSRRAPSLSSSPDDPEPKDLTELYSSSFRKSLLSSAPSEPKKDSDQKNPTEKTSERSSETRTPEGERKITEGERKITEGVEDEAFPHNGSLDLSAISSPSSAPSALRPSPSLDVTMTDATLLDASMADSMADSSMMDTTLTMTVTGMTGTVGARRRERRKADSTMAVFGAPSARTPVTLGEADNTLNIFDLDDDDDDDDLFPDTSSLTSSLSAPSSLPSVPSVSSVSGSVAEKEEGVRKRLSSFGGRDVYQCIADAHLLISAASSSLSSSSSSSSSSQSSMATAPVPVPSVPTSIATGPGTRSEEKEREEDMDEDMSITLVGTSATQPSITSSTSSSSTSSIKGEQTDLNDPTVSMDLTDLCNRAELVSRPPLPLPSALAPSAPREEEMGMEMEMEVSETIQRGTVPCTPTATDLDLDLTDLCNRAELSSRPQTLTQPAIQPQVQSQSQSQVQVQPQVQMQTQVQPKGLGASRNRASPSVIPRDGAMSAVTSLPEEDLTISSTLRVLRETSSLLHEMRRGKDDDTSDSNDLLSLPSPFPSSITSSITSSSSSSSSSSSITSSSSSSITPSAPSQSPTADQKSPAKGRTPEREWSEATEDLLSLMVRQMERGEGEREKERGKSVEEVEEMIRSAQDELDILSGLIGWRPLSLSPDGSFSLLFGSSPLSLLLHLSLPDLSSPLSSLSPSRSSSSSPSIRVEYVSSEVSVSARDILSSMGLDPDSLPEDSCPSSSSTPSSPSSSSSSSGEERRGVEEHVKRMVVSALSGVLPSGPCPLSVPLPLFLEDIDLLLGRVSSLLKEETSALRSFFASSSSSTSSTSTSTSCKGEGRWTVRLEGGGEASVVMRRGEEEMRVRVEVGSYPALSSMAMVSGSASSRETFHRLLRSFPPRLGLAHSVLSAFLSSLLSSQ